MKPNKNILLCLSVAIIWSFQIASGQNNESFSIDYKDSVEQVDKSRFVYNNIRILNKSAKPVTLQLLFAAAPGWKSLTNNQTVTIDAGKTTVIPLTFSPLPDALAVWLPAAVTIISPQSVDSVRFYLKAKAVKNYFFYVIKPLIQLKEGQKQFILSADFRNTGNTPTTLYLNMQCTNLEINKNIKIELKPGEDSVYKQVIQLTNAQLKNLQKEEIYLSATDSVQRRMAIISVYKLLSNLKVNVSPYAVMPIEIESGYMKLDNQRTYYGALRGGFTLNKGRRISYNYRTKDFGLQNQLQRNIFNINYTSKNLQLLLGQLRTNSFFLSDGTGLQAIYQLKPNTVVSAYGVVYTKNSFFKTNIYGGSVAYKIDSLEVDHNIAILSDKADTGTGIIAMNRARLSKKDKYNFEIKAGLGKDFYKNVPTQAIGPAFGYNIYYRVNKKWNFTSAYTYHSKQFPGYNRGLRLQNHFVRKGNMGVFYQSNQSLNNFFRDTIYNTTAFNLNLIKYGMMVSKSKKNLSLGAQFGKFIQTGVASLFLAKYFFYDVNGFYNKKDFTFSISALNGTGNINDAITKQKEKLWLTNLNGSIKYKFLEVNSFYTSIPIIERDSTGISFKGYNRSVYIGPGFSVSLFKKVMINANYGFSKTIADSSFTQFVNARVAYSSLKNGTSITLTGNIPIIKSNAMGRGLSNNFLSLSLIKKFNVPLLTQRKFYTLKVVAFKDVNGNGVKDTDEQLIKGIQVNINTIPFVTTEKGSISYTNIPKDKYNIDLNDVQGLKGFVPANGNSLEIDLKKSEVIFIPFKKSRVISGSVTIRLDSISHTTFSPLGIKVFATDTSGQYYSTLVDAKGDFFLNVPAGMYQVSLNPQAFDEKMRPVKMSHKVDLVTKEIEEVEFIIEQQKRKIRLLNN